MTSARGDNTSSSPSQGRHLTLKEALETHCALGELFERFGVAIAMPDLLLIGTGALHVCNIRTRPTDDLDFLLRRVSAPALGTALGPLVKKCIARQYAPHVFGLSVGGRLECDLICAHDRGVHEAIVDTLFERAHVYGSLKCAAPADIFTLKLAALADRLLRAGPTARVAKYRRDIDELTTSPELEIDLNRIETLLRRYDLAICETALQILANLNFH